METEKFTLRSIWARLNADMPAFWKTIFKIMAACLAVGGALVTLPAEYTTWLYSWAPANIGGTLITIGTVGMTLAGLTKKDTPA